MSKQICRGYYQSDPFSEACELYQRLKAGQNDPDTRQMLRGALIAAGLNQRTCAMTE